MGRGEELIKNAPLDSKGRGRKTCRIGGLRLDKGEFYDQATPVD
jgi:hypothetical protein